MEDIKSVTASIIVLTYRKFDNLERNLTSILEQSFKEYEIIIADDGSNNFPMQWITFFFSKKRFTKYKILRNKINTGTVRNYNNAIKNANGDYIIPLSEDDIFLSSDSLQRIISAFKIDTDICIAQRIGANSGKVIPCKEDLRYFEIKDKYELLSRLFFMNFVSGATTYYRKSALERLSLFDEDFLLLEDYPAILKAVLNNAKINIIYYATIQYGENGVTKIKGKTKQSQMLLTDKVKNVSKYVMPNMEYIKYPIIEQYIKYKYEQMNNNQKLLSSVIKYPKVVARLLLFKTRRNNASDPDYQYYKYNFLIGKESK